MAHHFSALIQTEGFGWGARSLVGISLMLSACSEPNTPPPQMADTTAPQAAPTSEGEAQLRATADSALTFTQHLCDQAVGAFQRATAELQTQLAALTDAPSDSTLAASQAQWQNTLQAWGASTPCLLEPLTDASAPRHAARLARTAAGPALAGFIDGVPGYEDSGLVHDENVVLSLDSLLRQHQVTDDGETALGLYTLEVLLFGTNSRPSNDFASVPSDSEEPEVRRSMLTRLVAEDLALQGTAWDRYWQLNSTVLMPEDAPSESILNSLHNLLPLWKAALEHGMQVAGANAQDRPGIALHGTHDRLLLQGIRGAFSQWWDSAAVLALVDAYPLDNAQWRQSGEWQSLPEEMGLDDWQRVESELKEAHAQLTTLQAQLAGT